MADADDSNLLNIDVGTGLIVKWAVQWLITFSPPNTESLLATLKHDVPACPPLVMNNNYTQTPRRYPLKELFLDQPCLRYLSKSFQTPRRTNWT